MSHAAGAKRLTLTLLWLEFFVAYLDRTNISVAGPAMSKALGMTPQSFGFVLSAFTAGYALTQIPSGLLADRFGAKRMLIAALVVWSVFTGLTGLAASIGMLIVIRVLFGVGEGLESGAHFKALGDTFNSRERSSASGVFHTSLALGPAVVAPVAALTIAAYGWQTLFLLFTIPGLIMAVLIWRFFPATTENAETVTAEKGHIGDVLQRPLAWLPFVAYLLFNVAFWGLLNWLPSYLSAERHIELKTLGFLASVPYLFGLLGLLALGYLGRNVMHRRRALLLCASYLLAGAGLFWAFTARDIGGCIAGLSFGAFFLFGNFGPFWAVALDLVPSTVRGTFSGFVNFGGQIGGFFSPIVVGAIVGASKHYAGGFEFMIAALLLAAITMLAIGATRVVPSLAREGGAVA